MDAKNLFVGREKEIVVLNEIAKQAFKPQGIIVGIAGPAGVGKSSLVSSFLEKIKDVYKPEILIGRCIDSDAMPFLPFTEALRKYFKVSGVDQPTTIEKLKEAFSTVGKDLVGVIPIVGPFLTVGISLTDYINKNLSSAPKEIEQSKLFYAVTQVLFGIAKKKNVVLVIEDIHLADKSSLNLFQYIARECASAPILIIVTYRNIEKNSVDKDFASVWRNLVQQNLAKPIVIQDFNHNEMSEYFEKIFGDTEIDTELANILYKHTHGNPFYLSQMLPVLLQENLLVTRNGKWVAREEDLSVNLPPTVESAIDDILHTLAPQELKTLEAASAIGNIFEYRVLASMTSPEQVDEQIDSLDNKKIISEIPEIIDVYSFIHSIIRKVVYQKLSTREKRRLHLKIAQTIEQIYQSDVLPVVEKLVHHYELANELEKTIQYSLMAARKAEVVLAYDDVLKFYQLALKHMKIEDVRFAETLLRGGEIADYSSQWVIARELYEKLFSVSKSQFFESGVIQATRGLSSINFREGKWDEAEKLSLEHLRLAEDSENLYEKSIGLFNIGQVYWRTGRWQQAEDALKSALKIQEENHWFERTMPTIAILGVVHRNQDEYEQALETYRKGIEIHSREKVTDQYWLGIIYNNMGTALRSIAAEDDLQNEEESPYWQSSVDSYENSLIITSKLKSFRDIGNTCNNLAIIYKSKKGNDLKKAMGFAQKARENLERINAPVDLLDNMRITGAIYGQSAQYNLAIQVLEESLLIAQNIKAKDKIGLTYMEIGTIHHRLGDTHSAVYYYKEALRIFTELGAPKRMSYIQKLLELVAKNLDAPASNPE
jgi:tetratricopeptide (TPR) repeat protein